MAHQIPNGDPALVVACALEALLREVKQRKVGLTDKPRTVDRKPNPIAAGSAQRGATPNSERTRSLVVDRLG